MTNEDQVLACVNRGLDTAEKIVRETKGPTKGQVSSTLSTLFAKELIIRIEISHQQFRYKSIKSDIIRNLLSKPWDKGFKAEWVSV